MTEPSSELDTQTDHTGNWLVCPGLDSQQVNKLRWPSNPRTEGKVMKEIFAELLLPKKLVQGKNSSILEALARQKYWHKIWGYEPPKTGESSHE